ncbi:MAG: hypothetical protein M3R49_01625 [Chloroflexota bacterium]|nr:hypothetical protein [Chloroflexota bacterium]
MGETLAETRLEVEAQRVEMERTAEQLRARVQRTLDLKAKFRENPALFVGLGAGAIFLLAGGPMRVARMARRRLMRTSPEKAYDTLPKPMQSWVDALVDKIGPRADEARQLLAAELVRWRHDPVKNKKLRKELAKQMVEGPPGPGRTAWKAFEAAAAIASAALARKAVERFLSGQPPSGIPPLDAASTPGGAAEPERYSSMSAGSRQR